jgi:signal transduction histidine kinase
VAWWDWALVAGFLTVAVVEALTRPDLEMRPVAFVLGALPIFSLLWRRSHPLLAVVVAYGLHGLSYVLVLFGDGHQHDETTLFATAFVLILPYSLLRWGSGRDWVWGMLFILGTHVPAFIDQPGGIVETIAGLAVLEFPAALGAAMRYRSVSRTRAIEQVKLRERELLARELHDTVAHHVSAIAIRAQAGRAVAPSDPAAALEALAVIEAEASRTLTEMRTMVGALRHGEEADLTPQRGVADLELLAHVHAGGPIVEVEPSGDLADLEQSVDAAVYRLAQESITNAIRHARRATHIRVAVKGEADRVRLTVSDDGDLGGSNGTAPGFGLVGMSERATLLGGTFEAGPNPDRGWTVTAVLPRAGS